MNTADLANDYLDALSNGDMEKVGSFLQDDVVVDLPMSLTGEPVPMFTFDGKVASMGYFHSITANFRQVRFNDRRTFKTDDGGIVFIEAKGDLIQRGTDASYRNTYCFKVTIADGKITRVSEYTNPIAWAKLMNLEVG